MKKILATLAAISLCTCALCGCDDDDKKENAAQPNSNSQKLENGKPCTEDNQCASDYCDKTDANAPVCGNKPIIKLAYGQPCTENNQCETEYCDYDNPDDPRCGYLPNEPKDCKGFVKSCGPDDIAYVSCDEANGGVQKVDCSQNTDGKTKCHAGECVNPNGPGNEYECIVSDDCKSKEGRPYCYRKICVEQMPEDPCVDVTCEEGTCDLKICVTDAMKNKQKGDQCNVNTFQSFCNDSVLVECVNSSISFTDCAKENIGTCTVVDNEGNYTAICMGNAKAIELCEDNESSEEPEDFVNVCYGNQDWGVSALCTDDVLGNMTALPFMFEDSGFFLDCEGKRCEYDESDQPVCGSEDASNKKN